MASLVLRGRLYHAARDGYLDFVIAIWSKLKNLLVRLLPRLVSNLSMQESLALGAKI